MVSGGNSHGFVWFLFWCLCCLVKRSLSKTSRVALTVQSMGLIGNRTSVTSRPLSLRVGQKSANAASRTSHESSL